MTGLLPRIKRFVARILTSPPIDGMVARYTRGEITNRGLRFDVTLPGWTDEGRAMLLFRIYESAEIRLVRDHLRTDLPVVELGTSLGVVASHITARLAPTVSYVGVEADRSLIPTASANLNRHARCRWTLEWMAVVPPGVTKATLDSPGGSLTGRIIPGSNEVDGESVPTTTLSDLARRANLSAWVLVLDIEGMEHEILDEDALDGCQQILMEMHATPDYKPNDLVERLESVGFTLRATDGSCVVLDRRVRGELDRGIP